MDRIGQLLDQTSRTFALGIHQLPASLERPVALAYLMLRVSDYFEDNEVMVPSDKIRSLNAWTEILRGRGPLDAVLGGAGKLQEGLADAEAVRHVELILDEFRSLDPTVRAVIAKHVADSTEGMARWVARGADFADEADLDDYMFEVAGRVGLLLTELFALSSSTVRGRSERLATLGREFGLGLQTVNVIRGLSTDPDRDWVFIPRDFVPAGTAPASLWDDPSSSVAMATLDRLVDKASRHLEAARDYVLAIPRRHYGIRVFCLLPLFFAVRTLALSRRNPAVFSKEVKLTRPQVAGIARATRLFAPSNTWIRLYFRRMSVSP